MRTSTDQSRLKLVPLAAAVALLAGCASFSPDGGFGPVEQTAREKLGKDVRWARSDEDRKAVADRVAELLAQPLSADDAVQIALLNNRGLQAGFHELGIREAEVVRAGRLPIRPSRCSTPASARTACATTRSSRRSPSTSFRC